jgi:hypothetical protein
MRSNSEPLILAEGWDVYTADSPQQHQLPIWAEGYLYVNCS